jgi:uncharacterized protein (UPF0335 family)
MADPTNKSRMASFLDRLERLEEERKAIGEDMKEVWKEAKAEGYDMKALRRAHSLRKLPTGERAMLSVYVDTLGLFD